jgi:hypothetical protein
MVDTVEREAARDWFIADKFGNRQDVISGRKYTTTRWLHDDADEVMLFSSFWVWVPADVFGLSPHDVSRLRHERAEERIKTAALKISRARVELNAAEHELSMAQESKP